MAKTKKTTVKERKGFEITQESAEFKWQTIDGFSFKNAPEIVTVGGWPVELLAFEAEQASKETLMVLVGPLEAPRVYKHLIAHSLKSRNVVLVCLPGFGANMDIDFTGQDIELQSFAPFVTTLMNAPVLEGHNIHLMGSSAAASIALETSLRAPAKVSSLIMNGLIHRPSKIWQLLLKEVDHRLDGGHFLDCADAALLYLVSDEILGRGRTWGVFRKHFRNRLSQLSPVQKKCLSTVVQLILMGDGLREKATKASPQCPVLAFTGEYDHLSAPFDHAQFIDTCANGTFATLDDADHLIHVERPRVVAALIPAFLDKTNLDTLEGVRTYPPQSYVTLDRRRDPRYVTKRPKVKLSTDHVKPVDDWDDEVPTTLFAKLRNINFSGCLLALPDERFSIKQHADDLVLELPQVGMSLKILAFEQVNKTLRCLFLHEDYGSAMAFKEMLDYGDHFIDADLEMDDFDTEDKRDRPWLGAKRQG